MRSCSTIPPPRRTQASGGRSCSRRKHTTCGMWEGFSEARHPEIIARRSRVGETSRCRLRRNRPPTLHFRKHKDRVEDRVDPSGKAVSRQRSDSEGRASRGLLVCTELARRDLRTLQRDLLVFLSPSLLDPESFRG